MKISAGFKAIKSATIAAALLVTMPAHASDDTTRLLAENLRAVKGLVSLGEQMKTIVTPQDGFTKADADHWHTAIDTAFAPTLLEVDFFEAFDGTLTDDAREAALTFDTSPLGKEMYELVEQSQPLKVEGYLDDARRLVQEASTEQNSSLVALFEAQDGPQRAKGVMEVYFRAMVIAAKPVFGAKLAEQWKASAAELTPVYVEDYFLTSVFIYGPLPTAKLAELVDVLRTSEMQAYNEQSTAAIFEALNAAVDRLEDAYQPRG
ncbi:hypothetical protein FPY71_01535 [Aureimonas fodinaquatilis]|uniref:DUF2059 domain-containing protein n=1 Tax=Aureimonas fodinaquatilis TaxID=2565783 RepID=A0A5B0E277_9HYPH|nr:hypothetical protein [Aureimonas fodinaquatilis]KAA0971840.1 hypothetical protein FPY71_01535 [Aureimonas fodinaquatilis]